MTIITSGVDVAAMQSPNQRKVDRCQNGVLWVMIDAGSQTEFWYSTNDGASWQKDPSDQPRYPGSMFIDLDDFCHFVYRYGVDGKLYYKRGTPNAGRTAWTWSSATTLVNTSGFRYLDLVVHRQGTGWKAHIVYSPSGNANNKADYKRLNITSGGTVTEDTGIQLSGSYTSTSNPGFPSIDFNHTGDGKTVAGGTPHLYVAWSAGMTGSGQGIRFRKAVYSAGPTWTWNTEREIDSTRYIASSNQWMTCLFDGTRVVMAGELWDGSVAAQVIYERDAADSATETRILRNSVPNAGRMERGTATYDGDQDVYMFGYLYNGTNSDFQRRKWDRSSTTYESAVVLETNITNSSYAASKRGYSDSLIEYVYGDGASPPYTAVYESLSYNTAPNAPTLTAPADAATVANDSTITFSWTHSDPQGDAQAAYSLRRSTDGGSTWEYWTGSAWSGTVQWITSSSQSVAVSGADFPDDEVYDWSVATRDPAGLEGPYATARSFTVADAVPAPVNVSPSNDSTVSETTDVTFQWDIGDPGDTQSAYLLRRKRKA